MYPIGLNNLLTIQSFFQRLQELFKLHLFHCCQDISSVQSFPFGFHCKVICTAGGKKKSFFKSGQIEWLTQITMCHLFFVLWIKVLILTRKLHTAQTHSRPGRWLCGLPLTHSPRLGAVRKTNGVSTSVAFLFQQQWADEGEGGLNDTYSEVTCFGLLFLYVTIHVSTKQLPWFWFWNGRCSVWLVHT